MKKILILSTALTGFAFAANADVTVMSWGGAYGEAQTEAHVKPWAAGICRCDPSLRRRHARAN